MSSWATPTSSSVESNNDRQQTPNNNQNEVAIPGMIVVAHADPTRILLSPLGQEQNGTVRDEHPFGPDTARTRSPTLSVPAIPEHHPRNHSVSGQEEVTAPESVSGDGVNDFAQNFHMPQPRDHDDVWPSKINAEVEDELEKYLEDQVEVGLDFLAVEQILTTELAAVSTTDYTEGDDYNWKKRDLCGLRFWFDFDSFILASKEPTSVFESIGTKGRAHVTLVTHFVFTTVKHISTRLLMMRPNGEKWFTYSNGRRYRLSDLSCMPGVVVAKISTTGCVLPLHLTLIIIDPNATTRGNGLPRWTRARKFVVETFFEIVRCAMAQCPIVDRSYKDQAYLQAWTKYNPKKIKRLSKKNKLRTTENTMSIELAHTFFNLWEKMIPNIESFIREYQGDNNLEEGILHACNELKKGYFFFCSTSGNKSQIQLPGQIQISQSVFNKFEANQTVENPEYKSEFLMYGALPFIATMMPSNPMYLQFIGDVSNSLKKAFIDYNLESKVSNTINGLFPNRSKFGDDVLLMFDLGLNVKSTIANTYIDYDLKKSKKALEAILGHTPTSTTTEEEVTYHGEADDEVEEDTEGEEPIPFAQQNEATPEEDGVVHGSRTRDDDEIPNDSYDQPDESDDEGDPEEEAEVLYLSREDAQLIIENAELMDGGDILEDDLKRKTVCTYMRNLFPGEGTHATGGVGMSWRTEGSRHYPRFPQIGIGGVQLYASGIQKLTAASLGMTPSIFRHFAVNVKNCLHPSSLSAMELKECITNLALQIEASLHIFQQCRASQLVPPTTRFEFYCIHDGLTFEVDKIVGLDYIDILFSRNWKLNRSVTLRGLNSIISPFAEVLEKCTIKNINFYHGLGYSELAGFMYCAHLITTLFGTTGVHSGLNPHNILGGRGRYLLSFTPNHLSEGEPNYSGLGLPMNFSSTTGYKIVKHQTYRSSTLNQITDVLSLSNSEVAIDTNLLPLWDQWQALSREEQRNKSDRFDWYGGVKSGPRNCSSLERKKTVIDAYLALFLAPTQHTLPERVGYHLEVRKYYLMSKTNQEKIFNKVGSLILAAYVQDIWEGLEESKVKYGQEYPGLEACFLGQKPSCVDDVQKDIDHYITNRVPEDITKIGILNFKANIKTSFPFTKKRGRKKLIRSGGMYFRLVVS